MIAPLHHCLLQGMQVHVNTSPFHIMLTCSQIHIVIARGHDLDDWISGLRPMQCAAGTAVAYATLYTNVALNPPPSPPPHLVATCFASRPRYTITDYNGCEAQVIITVAEPTVVVLALQGAVVAKTCNGGDDDGSFTVAASGGTGTGYTYALSSDGGDIFGSWQSSGTFSGLSAGVYTVRAKDSNDCASPTELTVPVIEPDEPLSISFVAAPNPTLCNGGTTTVTVSATGGNSVSYTGVGDFTVAAGEHTYVPFPFTCALWSPVEGVDGVHSGAFLST
jgi:hypothetical protein